jgi:hypothetical protein
MSLHDPIAPTASTALSRRLSFRIAIWFVNSPYPLTFVGVTPRLGGFPPRIIE